MKLKLFITALITLLFSCKKEDDVLVTQAARQQTYYTSVVFNDPTRSVDPIEWWRYVWPQVTNDPMNLSFTIVPGREATGPLRVNSWTVTIDGILVKQSATKKDFTYPQVMTIDVPETGVVRPYRGDSTKTWHLISVRGTHTDGGSFADGIYFYE